MTHSHFRPATQGAPLLMRNTQAVFGTLAEPHSTCGGWTAA